MCTFVCYTHVIDDGCDVNDESFTIGGWTYRVRKQENGRERSADDL